MKDLIERLEKATGPDKILDCDIRAAVEGWRNVGGGYREWPDGRRERYNYGFADPYTSSLDAALSLVPEGLAWTLGQNVHHRYWQASVNNLDEDGRPQSIGYSGLQGNLTAPIALCIAALRARDSAERDLTDMEAGK